jgi:hypothetical protein
VEAGDGAMTETWMQRAARLLRDAQACAEQGPEAAEEALTTANEAVYALRVELGEEPEPDRGGAQ